MELTQHKDNPPADNHAVAKDPFHWRRFLFGLFYILPLSFLLTQYLRFLIGVAASSSLESDFVQSMIRGTGTVFAAVFGTDFLERDRKRNAGAPLQVSHTDSDSGTVDSEAALKQQSGNRLSSPEGEVPMAVKVQAFFGCAFAYSLYYLFLAWLFNLLPGKDLPYAYAFAYGPLVAAIGFYGYRARRIISSTGTYNKDKLRFKGQLDSENSLPGMKTTVIAMSVWILVSMISMYKAFNDQVFALLWIPFLGFIPVVLTVLWIGLWSPSSRSDPNETDMAEN